MSSRNSANYRRLFWGAWGVWAAILCWAFFFQVNKAVVVVGVLQPFGKAFSVQSVRDGKLFRVMVEVGDEVKKGEPLILLESDLDKLALDAYDRRLKDLNMQALRFQALAANDNQMSKPSWAESEQWELENQLFLVERQKLERDLALLDKEQELGGLRIQNLLEKFSATKNQQELIEKQKVLIDSLYKQGFEGELSVLEADLKLQTFLEQLRVMKSAINEERTRLSMVERRVEKRLSDFEAMVRSGIYDTELDIRAIENSISETNLRIEQSILVAPEAGRVSKILVGNIGRFVSTGEIVMEIVPTSVPLTLYVNIPTEHISNISLGQMAQVSLTNMDTRSGEILTGYLLQIDGDATVTQSGSRFFEGVISVEGLPKAFQVPGVSGSASLQLGTQSVVEYFGEPIFDTLRNSFKE